MITNSNLHYILIKEIIDKGFAPEISYLTDYFNTNQKEVEKALYNLQNYHGVVLHPNALKGWVIHPFSLAQTNFFIKSSKGQWWGNCAWCSLGVAALLKTDLTITTNIGAEGENLTIQIENGEIKEKNLFIHFPIPMKNAWDNVIYTCSNMLVFESEIQIDIWTNKHNIPKGDVQPIQKIWEFSKKWYGNHLNSDWEKWTIDKAKKIFAEFELNHSIWELEDSKERF
ncbi:MAG: alkylmercury lyase family protein [Bacteroidetes bacterium]|nr:alkylmercury lyase family protein [Bacteroidota bacterium]